MFGDQPLQKVDKIKFLGVSIDHKLSWDNHIRTLTNKARVTVGQLYDIRRTIPNNLKNCVYNALVNSQMSYAISVWGGSACGDKLKHLFKIQKMALRTLFNVKRVSKFIKGHTKGVFSEHGILTIYNVYNYMTIINIRKLMKLEAPLFLYRLLNLHIYNSNNSRLYLPKLKLNQYQNNFCYQAPKLWNTLISSPTYCSSITEARRLPILNQN